ncbi:MAG: N-acetyltransferase [Nitrospirota bacterium]|nr:MAG: N-acetyltransferase [Nitrospirota bacterium]
MKFVVRAEKKEDREGIGKICGDAFGQPNEGVLVEKLRERREFVAELSLVAEHEGRIIGHALFFPVMIRMKKGEIETLALAPLSVHPDFQRKGVGARLVQEGVDAAKKLGYRSVIVVGHPEYYPMFGFRPASEWGIRAPFDVPDKAVMALELVEGALKNSSGTIDYPEEFSEV